MTHRREKADVGHLSPWPARRSALRLNQPNTHPANRTALYFPGKAWRGWALCGLSALLAMSACSGSGEGESSGPPAPVPVEYAGQHMPAGWWADQAIVEEGRRIFRGEVNPDVNCASCHGKDGVPVRRGARDFRAAEKMATFSDSYWYWRVSEGVPMTKMVAWKGKLTEGERWKVIAFEHTFSHGGHPAPHDDYRPVATAGGK